jgi:hypothetical protein
MTIDNLKELIKGLTGFGADRMSEVGPVAFVFVMVVALVSSIFIGYLYKYFFSTDTTGSQIHRSFPLLGISVTAIFVTIQFSLPLSLGLLGALSIVRFRTPIKEPEEIGFVMLVIASSITCATFNFLFQGIVLTIAIVGLVVLRSGILHRIQDDGVFIVTVAMDDFQTLEPQVADHVQSMTKGGRIESITKRDDQVVISYRFRKLIANDIAEFQKVMGGLLRNQDFDVYLNQDHVA